MMTKRRHATPATPVEHTLATELIGRLGILVMAFTIFLLMGWGLGG